MADSPAPTPARVTALLDRARTGDARAGDELFALVYGELRRLAARLLQHEAPGHTLQPTALVHEAYLRLGGAADSARDEGHYLALAARAMRRVLVDHARRRLAVKRGEGDVAVTLGDALAAARAPDDDLLALDDALERLGDVDARLRRVVECRFFAGYTEEETARALGITARTVQRDWVKARAWLHASLAGDHA